jgi:hypothetical protein
MRILLPLFNLALAGAAGYVAWSQMHGRIEGWALWAMVGFAALGVLLVLGSVGTLVRGARMSRVLRRSRTGAWVDGAWTVIHGTAVSEEEPLEAPFSGQPCIAYEYRVFRRVVTTTRSTSGETDRRTHTETAAFGIAQRPFRVRSPLGDIAVAGVALLDSVPEDVRGGETAGDRARAVLTVDGTAEPSSSALSLFSTLVRTLGSDRAEVAKHWRKPDAPSDPSGWSLGEKVVAVGDEVCVAGSWDATRRCLRPASGEALELVRGDFDEARRHWVRGSWVSSALWLLFGVLFLGMVTAFWWFAGEPDLGSFAQQVYEGNLAAIQRQLEAGVDPNLPNTLGTPVIFTTEDPAVVEMLLDAGADPDIRDRNGSTILQLAALRGEAERARLLLAAGADPDLAGSQGETPALAALRGGRWDLLDILLEAGATDPLVRPSTGRPLTESDEPYRLVRDFLEAVQQQDGAALGDFLSPERVEGADLETWARYRGDRGARCRRRGPPLGLSPCRVRGRGLADPDLLGSGAGRHSLGIRWE